MGILALALLAKGFIILFIILYIIKFIPVAVAFTVLENSKDELLTIKWFAVIYHFSYNLIVKIKETFIFTYSKQLLSSIKKYIKLEYVRYTHTYVKINVFERPINPTMLRFNRLFNYTTNKLRNIIK